MKLFTETLRDGRMVAFGEETEFLVQTSKGKGKYETRYLIKGDLRKALFWYIGINIRKPYNKRLTMPSSIKKPVLFREIGS